VTKTTRKNEPTGVDAVSKIVDDKFVWTFYVLFGKRRKRVAEAEYRRVMARLADPRKNLAAPRRRGKRTVKLSDGTTTQVSTGWPLKSEALAVHPSQVAEMNERNRRNGVNVEYCPKWGTAIIPDEGAYKRLRRLENVRFN